MLPKDAWKKRLCIVLMCFPSLFGALINMYFPEVLFSLTPFSSRRSTEDPLLFLSYFFVAFEIFLTWKKGVGELRDEITLKDFNATGIDRVIWREKCGNGEGDAVSAQTASTTRND